MHTLDTRCQEWAPKFNFMRGALWWSLDTWQPEEPEDPGSNPSRGLSEFTCSSDAWVDFSQGTPPSPRCPKTCFTSLLVSLSFSWSVDVSVLKTSYLFRMRGEKEGGRMEGREVRNEQMNRRRKERRRDRGRKEKGREGINERTKEGGKERNKWTNEWTKEGVRKERGREVRNEEGSEKGRNKWTDKLTESL